METLSLNMIVRNEEKVLARCLGSVANIVDEIIIVDTGSEDNTVEIAKSFGAKIFDYQWDNNFAEARNYSLGQSSCSWQLVLDADEYLMNDNCKEEINEFMRIKRSVGRVKMIDKFIQEGNIHYSQVFLSRLFPKGAFYTGRIHEQVNSRLPKRKAPITIFHDGYYLQNKTDRNIGLLKIALAECEEDNYYLYQLAKEYRLSKEFRHAQIHFEKCYRKIGITETYRPLLVVDYLYNSISGKFFENGLDIINNEKEKLDMYPDFHFVCGLFYMELIFHDINEYIGFFPLIEKEYCRCLEIGDLEDFDSVVGTGSFLAAYNLGNFYETTGRIAQAKKYYEISASHQYKPAIVRLTKLS